MSNPGSTLTAAEAPRDQVAVLDAIDAERRKIREWGTAAIREVEAHRDGVLGRLDRAVAALDPGRARPAPAEEHRPPARPSSAKSKRGRRAKAATPATMRKRREAVHRYLTELDEPVAQGEVCRALNISDSAARTALTRLREEGRVTRTGTGRATRHGAKAAVASLSGPTPPERRTLSQGTLQGRILATIQDRGSASLDELAQAIGTPRERVHEECGTLVREEEVRMARRDGRPVYVCQAAV